MCKQIQILQIHIDSSSLAEDKIAKKYLYNIESIYVIYIFETLNAYKVKVDKLPNINKTKK